MNAEEKRAYKLKNMQKTNRQNRNGENSLSNLSKRQPKRSMAEINAEFKTNTDLNTGANTDNGSNNIFFDSLNGMTQNDIVLNAVAKNVKKQSFDYLRYFLLLICLAVFIYAGSEIVKKIYSYIDAAREHDALRRLYYGDDEEELAPDAQFLKKTKTNVPIQDVLSLQKLTGQRAVEAEVSEGVRDIDKKRVGNMQKLTDINPDFYCWIKVEHTNISYPVAQTTNIDYYLHYSFENKRNASGAIFCDPANSRDISQNRNTVIYGHNMLDGSMFQPLIDYGRYVSYFQSGIIELTTEDAIYYYEVFSVRDEDPASGYIRTEFLDDEDFVNFIYDMKERSYFQKNILLDEESRIITLSTCVNDTTRDWRFVVQGVLVDIK